MKGFEGRGDAFVLNLEFFVPVQQYNLMAHPVGSKRGGKRGETVLFANGNISLK